MDQVRLGTRCLPVCCRPTLIRPGTQGLDLGTCAVPLDASALLADPHRYVGGFQGLAYDSGQVVPD
jgi:hypothetical protein